ncbi:hypothetical protein ACIBL6_22445 [Streptomyces sp. NPDC050400]|uniref:hypothetical protein n=1 Tax=Streptomyces sp. NPDC050400 TaxID=3365610 RepID=UPI0037BB2CA8
MHQLSVDRAWTRRPASLQVLCAICGGERGGRRSRSSFPSYFALGMALHLWAAAARSAALFVVLVVLWPYYDVLTLVGSHQLDAVHARAYEDIWCTYGFGALGARTGPPCT